jgi:hypothetical protein
MRKSTVLFLLPWTLCLLLPTLALADEHCSVQAPQKLDLDLSGVKTLQIDLGSNELHLDAATGVTNVQVRGRACASSQKLLGSVHLTQHREGDRLVLKATNDSHWNIGLFGGGHYAWLDLHVQVPANLAIKLQVGSGDAWIDGVASLDSDTGSGDLKVHGIAGALVVNAGSGDVDATDIGSLRTGSIGSGDVQARGVRGDVAVGHVGSGDLRLDDVHGSVGIDAMGSGDATLQRIGGSVDVGSMGSGDVDVDTVGGNLTVRSSGSGDVDYRNVKGTVDVPRDD